MMNFLNVQWKSHEFHPDGRKRSRPPASSVHGWIAKWRGTFSGDEKLRTLGMREMREASAVRKHKHNLSGSKISKDTTSTKPPLSRSASSRDAARSTSTSTRPVPQRSASMKNPEPKRSMSTRSPPHRSESMRTSHQRSASMSNPPRRSESTSRSTRTPVSPRDSVSRRATATSTSRPSTGSGTPARRATMDSSARGSLQRRGTNTSRK